MCLPKWVDSSSEIACAELVRKLIISLTFRIFLCVNGFANLSIVHMAEGECLEFWASHT